MGGIYIIQTSVVFPSLLMLSLLGNTTDVPSNDVITLDAIVVID